MGKQNFTTSDRLPKAETMQATIDELLNGPGILRDVTSSVLYDSLIIRPRVNTRFSFFRYHNLGIREITERAHGGFLDADGSPAVITESITNMQMAGCVPKGYLFAFNRARVLEVGEKTGLPLHGKLEATTIFQFVIGDRLGQRMPVEMIMEHVFRPTQNIDGLRFFYVDLLIDKPDLWPDETMVRVELHGAFLRPVM